MARDRLDSSGRLPRAEDIVRAHTKRGGFGSTVGVGLVAVVVAVGCPVGCSSNSANGGFGVPGGTSSSGGSSGGGSSGSGSSGGNSFPTDGSAPPSFGDGSTGSSGGSVCNATDPNADADKDGWSISQGDCNDCDPNVNPGAIDVAQQTDGGPVTWGDEDCDGKPGDSAMPCDQGLALDDVSAADAAKAIELCMTATATDRKYGVISAAYVRADGTPFATPGLQTGIESAWGTSV
ncbi:MAG TPA: hypothetical protein VIY73_03235, partial [Polyangiaceae bacterium]